MTPTKKAPEDVFTPRAPKINDPMYVQRPELEKELAAALRGTLHIIIHGESGTGKSWLYKRVLKDMGAYVMYGNLGSGRKQVGHFAGFLRGRIV